MSSTESLVAAPPRRTLRDAMQARFARWLAQRHPPRTSVLLDQRNAFVFPTREGLGFAVVVAMLLIGAINYQNSLVYLLAFLLGGVFVGCILATHRNLTGIRVTCTRAGNCHAGEHAQFEVRLEAADDRAHYGVRVGWPGEDAVSVDLERGESVTLSLGVQAPRRGRLHPGRMSIETFYPLGLVRSWSWIDFGVTCIVYPRAVYGPAPPASEGSEDTETHQHVRADGDDLYGLRDYRMGDTPRAIAWKQYAARGHVRAKEFAAGAGDREHWLRWRDLPGLGVEERLQRLTGWTLEALRGGRAFGLDIPGARLPPASGEAQRVAALTALALHGLAEPRGGDAT